MYVQSSLTDEMKMICKDTENVKHISDGVKLELNLKFQTGRNGQHSKSSVAIGILSKKGAEFYYIPGPLQGLKIRGGGVT